MAGIVFFQTEQRPAIVEFYTEQLDYNVWLEQEAGCTILKRDTMLLGFCDGETTETDGIVTIVVGDRESVDSRYEELSEFAAESPHENDDFDIYQFFATDPDGRTVEVQTFLHETPPLS